jgi:hypothetical protein
MNTTTHIRMLLTTAVIAAAAALLAAPAHAAFLDGEGGDSVTPSAAPIGPGTIPYLSHGIGVDETMFAGGRPSADAGTALTVNDLDPAIKRAIEARRSSSQPSGDIDESRVAFNVPAGQPSLLSGQQQVGGDSALTRVDTPAVSPQASSDGGERDWTLIGLGAGFAAVLTAGMAVFYLSARQRDRVALP